MNKSQSNQLQLLKLADRVDEIQEEELYSTGYIRRVGGYVHVNYKSEDDDFFILEVTAGVNNPVEKVLPYSWELKLNRKTLERVNN